jgi:hypothetical protein
MTQEQAGLPNDPIERNKLLAQAKDLPEWLSLTPEQEAELIEKHPEAREWLDAQKAQQAETARAEAAKAALEQSGRQYSEEEQAVLNAEGTPAWLSTAEVPAIPVEGAVTAVTPAINQKNEESSTSIAPQTLGESKFSPEDIARLKESDVPDWLSTAEVPAVMVQPTDDEVIGEIEQLDEAERMVATESAQARTAETVTQPAVEPVTFTETTLPTKTEVVPKATETLAPELQLTEAQEDALHQLQQANEGQQDQVADSEHRFDIVKAINEFQRIYSEADKNHNGKIEDEELDAFLSDFHSKFEASSSHLRLFFLATDSKMVGALLNWLALNDRVHMAKALFVAYNNYIDGERDRRSLNLRQIARDKKIS